MSTKFDNPKLVSKVATADKHLDVAIIWVTLTALFSIPLLFSYFDITAVFNELKLITLHLTAGLITILWFCQMFLRQINSTANRKIDLNAEKL